ncbi:tetrathionate reductase subunit C [Ignatzschineria ureiclastica]|uniref:Tetrathionate reductase subunit C n=1 Tax=Ignatzschineria ureiclastica TaxID=472582 RepID=A0A2U2AGD3_9GAMM|nr:NrfD/PsrC family molybdoenzyme membrane anchor subunit [Ignatzschineria ureiclastica]PWD81649.1 tetrathionate reductase subunit C [Ignatzschineria ureiclastica]GGZ89595.1 tetrathionate reductase subunit C [Ignatzschineria ureiclastica]
MIRELLTLPQDIAWLPWAVQYFFFIGIAASSALIAVGLRWWKHGELRSLELVVVGFGITAGIVGPIALLADLHQPGRFINFYTQMAPWSWMWIGALFVPLFVLFLILQFLLLLRENSSKEGTYKWFRALHWGSFNASQWLPWTAMGLLVSAFMILLYTGKELNVLKSQALWFTPWLPWALFFTALQVVPMCVKAWCAFSSRWAIQPNETAILSRIQVVALLGVAVALIGWAISDSPAGAAFRDLPNNGSVWWTIGISLFIYWALLLIYSLMNFNQRRLHCRWVDLLLALMSLSLAWTIRWAILMQTQTLPKYNIVINPYHLDWGFSGFLGILSTFGLWLTMLVIVWSLLQDNWFKFSPRLSQVEGGQQPA